MPARMAMIEITTSNSMRVNALRLRQDRRDRLETAERRLNNSFDCIKPDESRCLSTRQPRTGALTSGTAGILAGPHLAGRDAGAPRRFRFHGPNSGPILEIRAGILFART